MRHLVKGRKLGRTSAHRKATLQALSVALIMEHRIQTTVAKAKELRRFIEPLITRAKEDNSHNRRQVFKRLQDKYAVQELFDEIGPKAKDRPGGYTRVIKTTFRAGDATDMALIELVDYNDVQPESAKGDKKRTRRAGRSKKSAPPAASVDETAPVPEEEVTQEKKPATEVAGTAEIGAEAEEAKTAATAADDGSATDEVATADEAATPEAEAPAEEAKTAATAADEGSATDEVTDEVATADEAATPEAEAPAEEAVTSSDFNVDEVKERLSEMSVEEARAFAGADERVTVQKALEKIIESAASAGSEEKEKD